MNVYLIIHGKAEKPSLEKPHEDRELTDEGTKIVKASAEFWKNYINELDMIFSSPLKRAMQTALIIKEVFNIKSEVLQEVSLLNGGLTEDPLNIASVFGVEDIAMFGHQPDIGLHILSMTGSNEVHLKILPASIAKKSFNGSPVMGKGKLEFIIPLIIKRG